MATYTTPGGKIYPMFRDALSAPHLMIVGATGSGKSSLAHALIYTALASKFPGSGANAAQFILIDPKRLELARYRELPHVLRYASEPPEAVSALQLAVSYAETRCKAAQKANLHEYYGSHIYVVIDDFAALVYFNRKDIVPLVHRLTQIGKPANIHIILCATSAETKIVPTEIKSNFNTFFALHTSTPQESRAIMGRRDDLYHRGADCVYLPQFGQGYYICPNGITLYELPIYTDGELADRIKWWVDQKPVPAQRSIKNWLKNFFHLGK